MTATTLRNLVCGLCVWAAASMGSIASAQFVLQTPAASTTTGNQTFSGVGVEFQVNQAVSVLELGIFDSGQDGIQGQSSFLSTYLFDNVGTVLASATFSMASPGVASGKYLFQDIADVLLSPGTYVLAAYGWDSTNQLFNSNVANDPALDSTFNDGGGALTYLRSRWGSGSDVAGTFPLTNFFGPAADRNFFSAGNMVVAVVPEPEIYAMMGLGLGLIGWMGRRKKLKEVPAA